MYTVTKPRKAPPHLYDPMFSMRNRIMNLLETIDKEYPELARDGTYLSHRLANAKYAAEAKGILAVIEASNAYPRKEDAL